MKPIQTFTVTPRLPERLAKLEDLAYNLWWCWDQEAIKLWRRLSNELWEETNHNPVRMLGMISQERLKKKSADDGFLSQMDRVSNRLEEYLKAKTWYDFTFGKSNRKVVCYFSAEYGLTECLPIYSGGLGILAGDHLKSASDMGIPLAAIGLLYQVGYFRQLLTADGWQDERYPTNDFYNMPVKEVVDENGEDILIPIPFPGRIVHAKVWVARVGRVSLYLLDTNIPENDPVDRQITGQLYGGDIETRIQQEIILGVGGMHTLRKLGIHSTVYHMNEGHSAFLALERIKTHMERHDMDFRSALEATKAGNLFTTHTPVPAGIDIFPRELMEKYFAEYDEAFNISWEEFLSFGRQNQLEAGEGFSMAVLAMRLSTCTNAVSALHGQVSREMWRNIWPGVPTNEVPISHVTNGVHHPSYLSYEMSTLYDRYLGPRWLTHPGDETNWERIDEIPGEELWRTHVRRRERLVGFSRKRLQIQLQQRGALPSEVEEAKTVLDPEALTIGFARRFATYKRSTLIFNDPDRLEHILCDPERPVQIIFAGKAHPKDMPGKELIRTIFHLSREERFQRHIIFLEDYNTTIARYMVQGVDVWLNTPRRFEEASGTSGMKSSANGVLNVSILDGWWDEAYSAEIGWPIGSRDIHYDDQEYQNRIEAQCLYDILEHEVVPLFYDRSRDGLPHQWIERLKASMRAICPVFNTNRMLKEYTEKFYIKCKDRYSDLNKNERARAIELSEWKKKVRHCWPDLVIEDVVSNTEGELCVGEDLEVTATLSLGGLDCDDVLVEAYVGLVDADGSIVNGKAVVLERQKTKSKTHCTYKGIAQCVTSGRLGFSVRVIPSHADLGCPFELHRIEWA